MSGPDRDERAAQADSAPRGGRDREARPAAGPAGAILELQQSAGNQAVARLLSGGRRHGCAHLPPDLRRGLEATSGLDMGDVRVHREAPEAAALGAAAFARGGDVYLGPGGERHLPHEAWHVVQQKQRRVAPTSALPSGLAVNTDPGLEAEADRMGAAAAARGGEAAPPALSGVPADPVAPLQGVFDYIGQGEGQEWVWRDSETGDLFGSILFGPTDPKTGYYVHATVRRPRDGFSLMIRPTAAPSRWEPIETAEDQAIRLNRVPFQPHERVPRPKLIPSDRHDLVMEEEEVPAPSFTQSAETHVDYGKQAKAQLKEEGYRMPRLQTDFTVQVEVLPIAQGTPRYLGGPPGPGESAVAHDYVYSADQIVASRLEVGNQDRPDTYLEPEKGKSNIPQGRHTVAWALLRRSMMAMSGYKLSTLLDRLIASFQHMHPLVVDGEGDHLLQAINYPTSLTDLRGATLAADVWQHVLAQLIRVHAQIYHLSSGALFKGKSKQRGESAGVATLAAAEDALARSAVPGADAEDLAAAAADLLDVNFSIPPSTHAFAVHHWLEVLYHTYPQVMRAHGTEIAAPRLAARVTPSYPKQTAPTVGTVADLLVHFGYGLPDFAQPLLPQKATGELDVAPFAFAELNASFVGNVRLVPVLTGQAAQYTVTFGTTPVAVDVVSYVPGDLVVAEIVLSDQDRPKTRALKSQQSHTVAWTLVRHDVISYSGQPLTALLDFLARSFAVIKLDIAGAYAEAHELVVKAEGALTGREQRRMPLHDWQALVSIVVKWYAHAYSVSESASFFDARTHWRPEGHAEGVQMAALRRNEIALINFGRLVDTPARVREATSALLDAYIPSSERNEDRFVTAYDHWLAALSHTFPTVMAAGKDTIVADVAAKNVGIANAPRRLAEILRAAGRIT